MSHSFQKTEPGFTQNDAFQIHTLNPSEKPPPAPSAQSHVSAPVEACHPPFCVGSPPLTQRLPTSQKSHGINVKFNLPISRMGKRELQRAGD
jgi:hypothetical protein